MTVQVSRFFIQLALAGLCAAASAEEIQESGADLACARAEVREHVLEQFRIYGPLSRNREYFGFIYRSQAGIQSSVIRGGACGTNDACGVDTAPAARGIPPGAKVLGEWHTHPQVVGSRVLSNADVLGAYRNRRIRCYSAYYSQPDGEILSWDVNTDSVPVAMNPTLTLGNWRGPAVGPAIIAAHQDPGSKCLSTNTNAQTADTGTRYCKKSVTSR
jgi:hypothetical protein